MFEYLKDVLDLVEETVLIAEKISLSLVKRPHCSVAKALKVLRKRGATVVAIDEYKKVLVSYKISGVEEPPRSEVQKPLSLKDNVFVHSKVNSSSTATPFDSQGLHGEMLLYHRQLDSDPQVSGQIPDLTIADIQIKPSVFDTDRKLNSRETFESPEKKVTISFE
jgi:hypothetical protein